MSPVDRAMVHWTGGVGMFALLVGQVAVGVLLMVIAQLAYSLLERRP